MRDKDGSDGWFNRTVLGVGLASLLSDVSHETATSLLPLLAAELGPASVVLGAIEGISDAASGVAKLYAGWVTDRLKRLKPLAVTGYVVSALAGASLSAAGRAWTAVALRTAAWAGRGMRTPPRNTLLAGGVDPAHYGKAYGLERGLDTLGAVIGPLAASVLVVSIPYRSLLWWTIAPGLLAAAAMAFLVRETPRAAVSSRRFLGALADLPITYRRYLAAVGLYGIGDFAHSMLILRAMEVLTPSLGSRGASAAAIGLYGLHNITGTVMAFAFGAAGDRFGRLRTLTLAYALGPLMALLLTPAGTGSRRDFVVLAAAFILGGAMRAGESALEIAVAAETLPEDQRGMGFGALAAVNSAGDLVSSLLVGCVWHAFGPAAAFVAALIPMTAGTVWLGFTSNARD